jgi:hypothetical protein
MNVLAQLPDSLFRKMLYVFLLGGLLLLVSNVRDEFRGETTYYPPPGSRSGSSPGRASIADPNSNFRGAMIYKWCFAFGLLAIGGVGISLYRRYDRLDPFSLDYPYTDRAD